MFRLFFLLRRIRDLVEMIRPRTLSSDVELNGRQSGSLQWRLSRQETQENVRFYREKILQLFFSF